MVPSVCAYRNARAKLMELGKKAEDFEIPVSVPLSGRFPHEDAKCVILATDLPEDNFIAVEVCIYIYICAYMLSVVMNMCE